VSDLTVAESAFVSAATKTMHTQAEIFDLRDRMAGETAAAERSMETVLREANITETTPIEVALGLQKRLMEAVIERSELGEDHAAVQQLRDRMAQLEAMLAEQTEAESQALGGLQGPTL